MQMDKQEKRGTQNPLRLLIRAFLLWISGKVRFEHGLSSITIEDKGERFRAFRKIVVDAPKKPVALAAVIFKVRFSFKNLSPRANRRLSLIPVPLIVAQPGFRSKTWLIGETSGDFMGYYEFDDNASAQAYWRSLPLGLMRRRAAASSLTSEIYEASQGMRQTTGIDLFLV